MWKKVDYIIFYGVFFQSVRMITGSFSVIYVMSRGLSLSDIAFLKSIQAAVILFSDIPLSYMADRFSRKVSICLSAVFAAIWLSLMVYATTFFSFAVAEILNATSISLSGGAFIAYLIDQRDLKEKESIKDKISHYHQYQFFFMGVSAFLGAAFTEVDSSLLWAVSAMLMSVVFLLSVYLPDDKRSVKKSDSSYLLKGIINAFIECITKDYLTVKILLKQKSFLKQIIFILAISMLNYQIIIQYWQPFSLSGYDHFPKQGIFYGSLFMVILFVQSLASFLAKKMINRTAKIVGNMIVASSVIVNFIGLFFLKELLLFGVILIFMGNRMCVLSLQSSFHSFISNDLRSTLDSFISTFVRILLLLVFPVVGLVLQNYGWSVIIFLFLINVLLVYKLIIED